MRSSHISNDTRRRFQIASKTGRGITHLGDKYFPQTCSKTSTYDACITEDGIYRIGIFGPKRGKCEMAVLPEDRLAVTLSLRHGKLSVTIIKTCLLPLRAVKRPDLLERRVCFRVPAVTHPLPTRPLGCSFRPSDTSSPGIILNSKHKKANKETKIEKNNTNAKREKAKRTTNTKQRRTSTKKCAEMK